MKYYINIYFLFISIGDSFEHGMAFSENIIQYNETIIKSHFHFKWSLIKMLSDTHHSRKRGILHSFLYRRNIFLTRRWLIRIKEKRALNFSGSRFGIVHDNMRKILDRCRESNLGFSLFSATLLLSHFQYFCRFHLRILQN